MRTTLTIDDDVLVIARSMAAAKRVSVGRMISELARKGLRGEVSYSLATDGFPVFEVREDAPRITLEDVKKWEDEP